MSRFTTIAEEQCETEVPVGAMGIGLDYGGFGVEALLTADVERILRALMQIGNMNSKSTFL